jgi:hypothetical protein
MAAFFQSIAFHAAVMPFPRSTFPFFAPSQIETSFSYLFLPKGEIGWWRPAIAQCPALPPIGCTATPASSLHCSDRHRTRHASHHDPNKSLERRHSRHTSLSSTSAVTYRLSKRYDTAYSSSY